MHDANRVLRRLRLLIVHCDYDICLVVLLKCIAIHSSWQSPWNRPKWCQHWVVYRWGFWL